MYQHCALMPSSHLPWTPCDKFVLWFSVQFFGHRRWLRATAYVFTLSTGIVQFLLRGLGGQPGVNPYRDCAEIVQKSCNVSAVSARKSYGARSGIGLRTVPVRGLCNATYDMSTGYGLTIFFQICIKNFLLNQIVEAAEPVNPYENLTAASARGGRTERGIRAP